MNTQTLKPRAASPVQSQPLLESVATPAGVIDLPRFSANCERMIERVRTLGTRLRPHMKTMKSVEAAKIALDPKHGGIAVATLNEAAYFIDRGFRDVCYAVCISPDKLGRAAQLLQSDAQFSFYTDSTEVAAAIVASGVPFSTWIEIDCGEHRTGVDPDSPALLEIAAILTSGGVSSLAGIATHAGHSYAARTVEAIRGIAQIEQVSVLLAADRLRAHGFEVRQISVGSTPTLVHAVGSARNVTEFRAGVYMAGDLFQTTIGSLDIDSIAFSVLATVISRDSKRRRVVVDAGGLALSKDRSTATASRDYGFGLVIDLEGKRSFGDLIVTSVHQEHGELIDVPEEAYRRLPIGTKVRILPNHVCMTGAMYDHLHVVQHPGPVVSAIWQRTHGWQ